MRPASSLSPTTIASSSAAKPPATASSKSSSANFDDLWNLSLGGPTSAKPAGGATTGKSIKDLEKEKAMAGLWGGQQPKPSGGAAGSQQNAFGAFGNAAPPSSSGEGIDDLLF